MIRKIFFKVLIFLFILIIFDFLIGKTLQYFYFNETSGVHYRTNIAVNSTRADVLVFGASRAIHHYVPSIFIDSLNFSFYNVGEDGQSILYHLAILKAILKRYKPKIIILDFYGRFDMEKKYYDRLSALLPYYKKHKEIRPIIDLRSPYEKYKLLSKIYPYNSQLTTIAVGNMEFNKKRKHDYLGYVSLHKTWCGVSRTINYSDYEVDSTKINSFKKFVRLSKESGAKLYVIFSPILIKFNKWKEINIGKEICNKQNVPFLDFSHDTSFYKHPKLFQDEVHLNDRGATKFSIKLVEIIKKDDL